jgi:uncharacterized membrane protein
MSLYLKYSFLFVTGGLLYNLLEIAFRGWSHWSMFVLGGVCFVCLGLINEIIPWEMPIWWQAVMGACMITTLEFVTGCIVNLWLELDIWDYSQMPGNFLGQICPLFFVLWLLISVAGIMLDDWLRYWLFGEEYPHYKII